MPKIITKLPETTIRNAKPKAQHYKLTDEGGLRVLVRTSGTKIWQYHYRFMGKCKTLTLGQYPLLSTADARAARDQAKKLLQDGIDPSERKKAEKLKLKYEHKNNFEALAREWHSKQNWIPKHAANILSRLEKDIFPYIGKKPINQINRLDILNALQNIEARGALDVAKRMNQYCVAVFEYALLNRLCTDNPAVGLSGLIKAHRARNRPYLKERQLSGFCQSLEQYQGKEIIRLALKLLMLTFVRPGELRGARWEEIDIANAKWVIPDERMKMKIEHTVPLSTQALEVIHQIRKISGKSTILFPGRKNFFTPISDVTLLKAIKVMGYQGQVVPHGFRATASTILNENDFRPDVIERQLAHTPGNKVQASYNHAAHMKKRVAMVQWWGDYLEEKYQGIAIMPSHDQENYQKDRQEVLQRAA